MAIKAIETRYKGYRFRSRLEARWAVFFDALGVIWEYEKEGYDLGDAGWYLPDFWLPKKGVWAEIKPAGGVTKDAEEKCSQLAHRTGYGCLALEGLPDFRPYILYPEMCFVLLDCWKRDHESRLWWVERFDDPDVRWLRIDDRYTDAVYAARAARFEHRDAA